MCPIGFGRSNGFGAVHGAPGRLSEIEARGLFAQMAEALRHSHALDVVHRDPGRLDGQLMGLGPGSVAFCGWVWGRLGPSGTVWDLGVAVG